MIKRFITLPAALTLTLTLATVAVAGPARAARSDCYGYAGTVCLTAHANWGTPVWRQFPSQINGCRSLVPDGFNDVTTMVRNGAGGHLLVVWEHSNCTGNYFNLPSGQWTDLSGNWWNDEASAVEVIAL